MARVDEWVEVAGSSVELAVDAALRELGLASRDEAIVEVLQEPSKGILGTAWRAQDAVVKVIPKPEEPKKRRRRSRKRRSDGETAGETSQPKAGGQRNRREEPSRSGGTKKKSSDGRSGRPTESSGPESKTSPATDTPAVPKSKAPQGQRQVGRSESKRNATGGDTQEATIEEQATVAATFITGLLEAFGLEGSVETEIDDDILKVNVTGDDTEALVGRKGATMQSVHEITRTVVQRKTFGAPRMRLDINGYGERRREALKIYTVRQAERVLADGGEIMLEPMNPADRKVVHDAVGEIDGVDSFSEGVEPHRAVVISPSGDAS
ncbi:MAG TPA: RNA-binding cell elongation regulator Jag/EloR [Acidimicrobiia bacterium]|nr:RNA-binding cell elongation regulator Jag/EloR [Acidimicrobiia bacterium]